MGAGLRVFFCSAELKRFLLTLQFVKKLILNWKIWLLASLTLGLAPFSPEPHIWGKIRWVWGGAVDMPMKDWLDLFMHGTPWLLLILSLVLNLFVKEAPKKTKLGVVVVLVALVLAITCVFLNADFV